MVFDKIKIINAFSHALKNKADLQEVIDPTDTQVDRKITFKEKLEDINSISKITIIREKQGFIFEIKCTRPDTAPEQHKRHDNPLDLAVSAEDDKHYQFHDKRTDGQKIIHETIKLILVDKEHASIKHIIDGIINSYSSGYVDNISTGNKRDDQLEIIDNTSDKPERIDLSNINVLFHGKETHSHGAGNDRGRGAHHHGKHDYEGMGGHS